MFTPTWFTRKAFTSTVWTRTRLAQVALAAWLAITGSQISPGQQASAPVPPSQAASRPALEFPVVMREKVVAGKTLPGTRVQANLEVATLFHGKVIPRNALLSGEVIGSQAKTANGPSRLSIRLDSVEWKGVSTPVQLYLTSWYYPIWSMDNSQNLQYGPEQPAKRTWNGMGEYPSDSPTYKPFPASVQSEGGPPPGAPSSVMSNQHVSMKDVELERDNAGVITLIGKRSDIKLDKITPYLFVAMEPPSNPQLNRDSAAIKPTSGGAK